MQERRAKEIIWSSRPTALCRHDVDTRGLLVRSAASGIHKQLRGLGYGVQPASFLDSTWTPLGLQNAAWNRTTARKSLLRNLVGLPRFELGTSCTPSKRASQAAPQPD